MEDMPPGFRFYPTEEELVSFYLYHKLERKRDDLNRLMHRVIPTVDIYEFNPWDLPQFSVYLCHKDPEQWFFFIPRQESEARGGRPKRLTTDGYWKATGSPSYVYSSNHNLPIGVKRTMVFYKGRAPSGRKTEWKMNEYKAIVGVASPDGAAPILRHEFSLCRIYKKLSKCLRSFDRRPEPAGRGLPIGELPAADHHQGQANYDGSAAAATASLQHSASAQMAPVAAVERSMSSSESSSPGDHGNYPIISQTGETSNLSSAMLVDFDESFWHLDGFWNIP